jgi:hypothetical protein
MNESREKNIYHFLTPAQYKKSYIVGCTIFRNDGSGGNYDITVDWRDAGNNDDGRMNLFLKEKNNQYFTLKCRDGAGFGEGDKYGNNGNMGLANRGYILVAYEE